MKSIKRPIWPIHYILFVLCVLNGYTADVVAENSKITSEFPDRVKGGDDIHVKLGVVLSGGGARGMAHVGVLKRLEELRIPIDYITGTSMGGIVAGLYASGMSASEIEKVMIETDWLAVFNDDTSRKNRSIPRKEDDAFYPIKASVGFNRFSFTFPKGIIEGQKISLLIRQLITPAAYIDDFDQFEIPLRIVATNIEDGEQVVLKGGNIADAIKASMSIPGVFSPVEFDGKLLVDGGLSNNLPVNVARKQGAERIIAIDVSTPLLSKEKLESVLDISGQLTGLQVQQNTLRSIQLLNQSDFLIAPDLKAFSSADFLSASDIIRQGYLSVANRVEELKQYSISADEYQAYRKRLSQQRKPKIHIESIRIENNSPMSEHVIREYLGLNEGDDLKEADIRRAIDRLYGLGYFDLVTYDIEYKDRTTLVVSVYEKSWGPNYLNFGLLIRGSGFTNNNALNLRVGHTQTLMNRLGGEWENIIQIGSEPQFVSHFYQPLDYGLRYFIQPEISYRTKNYFLYNNGEREAQYQSRKAEINLAAGREFEEWGRVSFRAGHFSGRSVNVIGSVVGDNSDFTEDYIGAHFRLDRLNNIHFPTQGSFGLINYTEYFAEQANDDYTQIEALYLQTVDFNRNTLIARLKLNYSIDDIAPFHSQYRAGGFLNMSGFSYDELIGKSYGHAMLVYLYKASIIPLFPVYLGASAEAGNMWQKKSDISIDNSLLAGSLFLGVDSVAGPFYLAAGYAEGGHKAVYLNFGYSFFL